jgi:hypothetical protein
MAKKTNLVDFHTSTTEEIQKLRNAIEPFFSGSVADMLAARFVCLTQEAQWKGWDELDEEDRLCLETEAAAISLERHKLEKDIINGTFH